MPRPKWIARVGVPMLIVLLSLGASAQDVQRIAAVVNDEVISVYDLIQRIRLVLLSSNVEPTAEQQRRVAPNVLNLLIDERLRVQEAERQNVRVTDEDMESAIAQLERNNNVPPGQFGTFVARSGLSQNAVEKQVRAQLAWEKFLARRVQPTIEIGEEEVDRILSRIDANRGQREARVAEIRLPVDDPGQEGEIRQLAQELVRRIREGAAFSSVASQFSQSASAANGGDIGWIQPGQLEPEIDTVIEKLDPGQLAGPVETPDGFLIIAVIEDRISAGGDPNEVEIALRQILVPLESDAAAKIEEDGSTLTELAGCDAFAAAAEELGVPQPPDPTRIKIGDLNDRLRDLTQNLPVGQVSEPYQSQAGIQMVMVCERDDSTGLPPRDQIRDTLVRERLDMLSRRYLRDLRRAAIVDIRI